MKKCICLILSVMLSLGTLSLNVSAAEEPAFGPSAEDMFVCEVYPEKSEYSEGEEINICLSMKNTSLDAARDVRVWIDYPLTDYCLTPGVTEACIEKIEDEYSRNFRMSEYEQVLKIYDFFSGFAPAGKAILRLAHAYRKITLFVATLKYRFANSFFGTNTCNVEIGKTTAKYDGTDIEFTVYCRYTAVETENNSAALLSDEYGIASAKIKALENSYTGLVFGSDADLGKCGLFLINPDEGKAFLYTCIDGRFSLEGTKSIDISPDKSYEMSVFYSGKRAVCRINYNPLDENPYPVFDTEITLGGSGYGVFAPSGAYTDFEVKNYTEEYYEATYCNPVYVNAPDPYILFDDGIYYLYATTDSNSGFRVSQSSDLANWENKGYCARKGDIFGETCFWAPEVYKYNGSYYLLYSTDEHIALAVSDSPCGPFRKTADSYLFEEKCIDGHILFDDDGSIYLYRAYWGKTGEEIWGCRLDGNLAPIAGTDTQLTSCGSDEYGVNEGPYMLKHNGKYYLTYSVDGYTSKNYRVMLSVSDSPLGKFESRGAILERAGGIVGTGHHSFAYSPDGSELFIVYHCHYSATRIHERKLCIDRCKFVDSPDGCTISVYGPTSTPQPLPSMTDK